MSFGFLAYLHQKEKQMSLPILLFYGFAFLGIVHSVIFSFLAIKNKNTADLIITFFLLAQSIIILEYVFFWTGLQEQYHQLCNISLTLQLLFGPLLLIYVDYVFSENKKKSKYIFHFIPAIVIFIFMLPYYLSTANLKIYHYKMIKYFVLDLQYVTYLIMAHMTAYFIVILLKIKKEKRIGHINNWLLIIVGLFGFYTACYISYFIMVRQSWFTLTTDYFVSTGMCVSIVSIIYMAYGKKKILDGFPVTESLNLENIYFSYKENIAESNPDKKKDHTLVYDYTANIKIGQPEENVFIVPKTEELTEPESFNDLGSVKYKNSGLTADIGNELAEALKQLMLNEKLYRESELKLETLAIKLGVAKHYVSQVINQYYKVNFFEYINMLRIEDAKQLLLDSDKKSMNIIEVAYTVGYNTKNTFNTAFRRIVGVTPTAYRNQNKIRLN